MTSRVFRIVVASVAVVLVSSGAAAEAAPEYVGVPAGADASGYVGVPAGADAGGYVGVPAGADAGGYVGLPAGAEAGGYVGLPAGAEAERAVSPVSNGDLAGLGGLSAAGVSTAVIRRRLIARRR